MNFLIALMSCLPAAEDPGYTMVLYPAATETAQHLQRPVSPRLFRYCMQVFDESACVPGIPPAGSRHHPSTLHPVHQKYREAVAGSYLLVRGDSVVFGSKHKEVEPYEIVIALERSERDNSYRFAGLFCVDFEGRIFLHKPSVPEMTEHFDRALKSSVVLYPMGSRK